MTKFGPVADPPDFTAEQRAALASLADSWIAGRRFCLIVAWVGGILIGLASLAYYVTGVLHEWGGR
jgi:hypothetical protein